ncbi:DinB family protein [Mobilicoccus massiliensis]|uniref:DinB family protein n=1 Tax=Mobilicoccus massiliensis TaxID=1522310 RepID=UPI00058CA666|nr:DinB family protein [Mobilicoccus massiliensis]
MTISEPASGADLRALLLDYLDYYRSVVVAKLDGLPASSLRQSRVPSGWTPSGLVTHLAHMERRWLVWGFLAEPVPDPWGDSAGHGWRSPAMSVEDARALLEDAGRRTREIVEAHDLADVAAVGGRFRTPAEAPRLQWILLHVLQEFARHTGHLDIARELVDGRTGETR